jgi:hypothetical protein
MRSSAAGNAASSSTKARNAAAATSSTANEKKPADLKMEADQLLCLREFDERCEGLKRHQLAHPRAKSFLFSSVEHNKKYMDACLSTVENAGHKADFVMIEIMRSVTV